MIIVTEFRKIDYFVTFNTLNISSSSKALFGTNQICFEHRISLYNKLPEVLGNILKAACVLLWQQGKALGSIYFTHDKVVDFPKSSHNYYLRLFLHAVNCVVKVSYICFIPPEPCNNSCLL